MRRLLPLLLLLAGCSASSGNSAAPSTTMSPTIRSATVGAYTVTATLTDGSQRTATAPGVHGDVQVVTGGQGFLAEVGQGATTVDYGLWILAGDRLVRADAPAGEPGSGQSWSLAVGAGAVTGSGVRCRGDQLVVLSRDADVVTAHAYVLAGGAVRPGPAVTDLPTPAQVGSLDC